MKNLASEKYRDALITLTEQVNIKNKCDLIYKKSGHQENKDEMINQNLVPITSTFLHHEDAEIRHEAVILLGSLISIMRGREMVIDETFTGLEKLLFDESLFVRYIKLILIDFHLINIVEKHVHGAFADSRVEGMEWIICQTKD